MVKELNLSGYQPYTEVLAQHTQRGVGRHTYIVALPLHLISQYVPIPDPEKPFPGNRRVNKRHAEKFGEYWRNNEDWVAPPLLVDTLMPLHEEFDVQFRTQGVEVGILKIHQAASTEFAILDGQHRILGWKLIGDRMAQEIKDARSDQQLGVQREDEELVSSSRARIEEILSDQRRFETEYVTLEIMQGVSEEDHKQAFNDIATNARGITKSVNISFDRRSMINRIAMDIAENLDFLKHRVDWEKDRVTGSNECIISGKNLADIVRHVAIGIDGRMTNRRENEMSEGGVYELVEEFFSTLVGSFPQLRDLQEDDVSAPALRERDMIMSATILRVLSGVFHNLVVDLSSESSPKVDKDGLAQARAIFVQLSENLALPVDERWMKTGYFSENAKAPSSRAQDLRGLTNLITQWAKQGQIFTIEKGQSA